MRPLLIPPLRVVLLASLALAACSNIQPQPPSAGHIRAEAQVAPSPDIPAPVAATVTLARPKAAAKAESYSVSVRNIPVQDLLFALARDAKLNVDIHPGINGIVTINAIDQSLQQILTRVAKQVDMRWELDGPNLVVMPDSPFLRNYKVDYVNMSRDVTGTVSINTQIGSTSTSAAGSAGASGGSGGGGNNSSTSVKSVAKNEFWHSLEKNLKDILHESDKILPEGSSETVIERSEQQATTGTGNQGGASSSSRSGSVASLAGSPNPASLQQTGNTVIKRTTFREAASIIVNPEAGVVVVRATSRQHEKVQEYLDLVLTSSRRQVIIEATIAEVTLSDQYQQGINWASFKLWPNSGYAFQQAANYGGTFGGVLSATSVAGAQAALSAAATPPAGAGSFLFGNGPKSIIGLATLLETFGKVKVLSSPKISVLNNQTAMLKVVNNLVYFTIKTTPGTTTNGVTTAPITTATAESIAVGLVMSVTPQISENGSILLNVRPSISSKLGDVQDPTPGLAIVSNVPQIQQREMESMLRLSDGEVAVMGGLMEDRISYNTNQVPGLGDIPVFGNIFRNRGDTSTKTELVIFLKPTVIRDPSVNGDYRSFRDQLPRSDFFSGGANQQRSPSGSSGVDPR